MTDGQTNEIDKVDGTLNITEKGDVNNVMQFYLNDANRRDLVDGSITKDDVVKVYTHLQRRWESAYDAFVHTFPRNSTPRTEHAPALRGELELLSDDIARVRQMVARLNREGVDDPLVKADEFKMAYMQPIEAFNDIADRRRRQSSGSCYVVTATYGFRSRESVQVHRRCRYAFLMNPFLTIGWLLYRFYGPLLAGCSRRYEYMHRVNQRWIASEIVAATDRNLFCQVLCLAASNCTIRSSTYSNTLPVESIVFLARQVLTSARDETDEISGLTPGTWKPS